MSKTPYQIALEELSAHVAEIPGPKSNPRVLEYFKHTSLGKVKDDSTTPWCAAFVNFCVVTAGLKGTNSAGARSFLKWGVPVKDPKVGDIVVLRRGTDPSSGHVGFLADKPGLMWIIILSGNQNDKVCIQKYLRARVLGYRRSKIVVA